MKRKYFLLTLFVFGFTAGIIAQPVSEDLPQITGCIALINAKVISAPGKPMQVETIIMRDGLITDIGPRAKIPSDAYRIQADSLYAYPAFIDAFSSIGVKNPESDAPRGGPQGGPGNRDRNNTRPSVDEEGNPSLEDAGITPFRSVRPSVDIKEKSIADWRGQGFAIAHIVPKGKMIPGKGSLIVLSGKETGQLFWKEDVSMFAQWSGAGDNYPSTVIGIMAKWRELYHNASQDLVQQTSYTNATLVPRPHYNQAHEALLPVVKRDMPVYFRAPKVKDISRALALQKDLGMKMVISDAEEAWYLKDQFKTGTIPLVLSLALPEDKSENKKDKAEAKAEAKEKNDEAKAEKKDTVNTDPEKEEFEKKRAQSLKEHYAQASVLAKDGIPFSFGTLSGKSSDFTKNIRLMMDNGLTNDQVLSALTSQPAKLLGIEKNCGTIDIGKMANVIVSTKPIFEKDAAIRYMIVEGNLYAYDEKEKKKVQGKESHSASTPSSLAGTWSYTIDIPDQKKEGTMEFIEKDGSLTGTIHSSDITSGNNELESIVLDVDAVAFTFDFEIEGQLMVIEFNVKLKGESFDGSVTIADVGSFSITGQRMSKPKN
ncbi:MAG: amidohydrolase family protein [Saprospiraceae bacterium]|uniref:Amidohydrolase family protein n=1 Tax=Candidatus Opimibacter skivensis TaxID=2982028 RepID=A0A9D7SVU4_9BACT|nr:amidohydrolase family protein [Candidatus Opimibacter skivensis]